MKLDGLHPDGPSLTLRPGALAAFNWPAEEHPEARPELLGFDLEDGLRLPAALGREARKLVADRRIRVAREPVDALHEMAVGVVALATGGVRLHRDAS